MPTDLEPDKRTTGPLSGQNAPEFSVSELAGAIKRAVEDGFGHVRLRGEISGYRGPHASGHAYFALKDDKAKIEAVIWRGVLSKLRFKPEEGMEVVAEGVEEEEQMVILEMLYCDKMQGFLFSRPLETQAFESLMDASTPFRTGPAPSRAPVAR